MRVLIFWLTRLVASIFYLSAFSIYAQQDLSNSQLDSAACFVHDSQNRVLVVKELISSRFSLPGGYINKGETPEVAARRKTFEETGIEVEVLNELARLKHTTIFACQSQSAISIYNLNSFLALIPFWKASSFSKEIETAYFMKIGSSMLYNSRFPEQVSLYFDFINQSTPSLVRQDTNFSKVNEDFFIVDTSFSKMSNFIKKLPQPIQKTIDNIFYVGSWFGDLDMFFILLPLTIAMGGMKRASQLALGLVIVLTTVTLMKILLAIPRPMHIFPELMFGDEWQGYAFPSAYSAVAFFTWGLVYIWFHFLGKSAVYLCLFPGLLVGLSRIYFGASQPIDVFVGALIGIAVSLLVTLIYQMRWLYKPIIWYLIGSISAFFAVIMPQPVFFSCTVFCFVYGAILYFYGQAEINLSDRFNLLSFVLSLLGMILILIMFENMNSVSSLENLILLGQSVSIVLLTIWMSVITPRASSIN